jgi:hypothetical protein
MLPWHSGRHGEYSGEISRLTFDILKTDEEVTHENGLGLITKIENEAREIIFREGKIKGKRWNILALSQNETDSIRTI